MKSKLRRFFDDTVEPSGDDKLSGLYNLFVFALILIGLAACLYAVVQLCSIVSNRAFDTEKLGQTGDFFGGMLNPLLTFLTFIAVLSTVFLQRQELSLTRAEMEKQTEAFNAQIDAVTKQNFEATLFQMLGIHNDVVNSLSLADGNGRTVSGRTAFAVVFQKLSFHYLNSPPHYPQNHQRMHQVYNDIYSRERHILGHYFRLLFNIFRFIEEKCPSSKTGKMADIKMTYVRVVRAQLSDAELAIMFYNATVGMGAAFLPFIKDFDILDNLDGNMLFDNADRTLLATIRP